MVSFTYCKQLLLYHRKVSLTQLSGHSYIIGSSPLTQHRQPLLCKRVLSPRYECSCIYIKGHSLYLLWAAAPISILNNEGSRKWFYHLKRGNSKAVFTFSKEYVTGGAVHHSCLSLSYDSINSILSTLADSSIDKARQVASGPHALAYDNINILTSIFVEQVPGMPNKVQSRTFSVIYELLNANPIHMDIQSLVERLKTLSPLLLLDLCPQEEALLSYLTQATINICHILVT